MWPPCNVTPPAAFQHTQAPQEVSFISMHMLCPPLLRIWVHFFLPAAPRSKPVVARTTTPTTRRVFFGPSLVTHRISPSSPFYHNSMPLNTLHTPRFRSLDALHHHPAQRREEAGANSSQGKQRASFAWKESVAAAASSREDRGTAPAFASYQQQRASRV